MQQNNHENLKDSHSRHGPQSDELVVFTTTLSRLALAIGLFLLFSVAGWGVIAWYEVFQNKDDGVYDTVNTVIANGATVVMTAVVLTAWTLSAIHFIRYLARRINRR